MALQGHVRDNKSRHDKTSTPEIDDDLDDVKDKALGEQEQEQEQEHD